MQRRAFFARGAACLALPILLTLPIPASAEESLVHAQPHTTGHAPLGDIALYYEIYGEGEPLVLLHGGLGMTGMFTPVLPILAERRKVIAVDLQGHGRTADVDRPIRYETMADDVAGLIGHLGLGRTDVLGYSMGGGVGLRLSIQHPELVRRLVAVSAPHSNEGWYPDIREQQQGLDAAAFAFMKDTPMYETYVAVAPDPDAFPQLLDKMGDLMRHGYDWSEEVRTIAAPTLLIYGDADMIPPAYIAQTFALLGGGLRDAGWDGAGRPASQLAILPGYTHYDVFMAPEMARTALKFLNANSE